MLRGLFSLITLAAAIAGGGWWLWNHNPVVENFVDKYIQQGQFPTLEMRYTAENIMELNGKTLLQDSHHKFSAAGLHFYPYLLLEVKYSREAQTGEGMILWGLADGEMVINTETWERSHGFKDCINAQTTRDEFKLINALSYNNNRCDRARLLQVLRMEEDTLDGLINSLRKKKIIVQTGNDYRLHFDSPKLNLVPATTMAQSLVTRLQSDAATRIPKLYSAAQIKQIAQSAFGADFAIRAEREVFLPVHRIVVENPDGTLYTTYWNSLNGKQMSYLTLQ